MPVLKIECPKCDHTFQSLVLAGTRAPEIWICSKCGSKEARVSSDTKPIPHPWESEWHGHGLCLCCGVNEWRDDYIATNKRMNE